MTARELIEILQKYPPDERVITRGYEGGYEDVEEVKELEIVLDVNKESWMGPHDSHPWWQDREKKADETAIYID